MESTTSTVFELVLEEVHIRREDCLREWQESSFYRHKREFGLKFLDEWGKTLSRLCLVHPSWTNLARRALGRILMLSDITMSSARAAASAPTFGSWTREAYLSFSRGCDEHDIIWNYIRQALARTPNIVTFCLQTASRISYDINRCVVSVCDILHDLTQLHTLHLYSDECIEESRNIFLDIVELPSLFRALENIPNFERLMLRNFVPCFKLVRDERIVRDYPPHYDWLPVSFPNPYLVIKLVADSPTLTDRVLSLVNLIQSICNTPMEVTEFWSVSMANCMRFASFAFDSATQQFIINGARIGHSPEVRVGDLLPPTFNYSKWCGNMEFLEVYGLCSAIKGLSPYPSLKFLQAGLSTSHEASSDIMREELAWFVNSLPASLEALRVKFHWRVPERERILPQGMHEEIDGLLATIPTIRCPDLQSLFVDVESVSKLFREEMPLNQLINACKERDIPLNLFSSKTPECFGEWRLGFDTEKSLAIESHLI